MSINEFQKRFEFVMFTKSLLRAHHHFAMMINNRGRGDSNRILIYSYTYILEGSLLSGGTGTPSSLVIISDTKEFQSQRM